MARLIIWCLIVGGVIGITAYVRFDARKSYAVASREDSVLMRAGDLLSRSEVTITGQIRDRDRGDALVGYRFRETGCRGEKSVVAISVKHVARSVIGDFATKNDDYKFYYQDYAYDRTSRPVMIGLWVVSLISSTLNIGEHVHSKLQLGVIWPRDCQPPVLDWSRVWKRSQTASATELNND